MIGLLTSRNGLLVIATAIAVLAMLSVSHLAYRAGAAAVRQEWQTAQLETMRKAEAERRAAQAHIDAAELKYVQDRAGDALRISALEEALQAKDALDADPAASCPARPAVPRRVSGALDRIGR